MTRTNRLTCLLAAGMLLGVSSNALSVPLSSLTAGGSLTEADVTFDAFAYTDVGGGFGDVAVSADDIDVTASSTASSVSLLFSFAPIALGFEDVFEINGIFSTTVTGSLRELINVALELDAAVTGTDPDFVFVELGSNTLSDSATVDPSTPGPVSFSSALAGLSTFALEWDLQGEAGDPGTAATVSAFEVTFDLRTPPPPAVPEPAVLWLMLSGLIGVGALRKPVDRRVAG